MKQKAGENKRKKSAILVVLLLLLVVVVGGYTYSRYMSSGTANSTATIAKWSVKIGSNDLDSYTTDAPLNAALNLSNNAYVSEGVIAPGRSGTFEVEIDPSGSQVAIDYVIKVDGITGLATENSNIKLTGAKYWIGDTAGEGQDATVTGDDGITISQDLADVEANKKITVKATIEWENDETNNTADTTTGKAAETATVKTSIVAKQHIAA